MKKLHFYFQARPYLSLCDAIRKKTGYGFHLSSLVGLLFDSVSMNEADCLLTGVSFYRGAIPTKTMDSEALKYDRLTTEVIWTSGYDLYTVPMYPKNGGYTERGVDVALACQAVRDASLKMVDVAVLFVTDTDYHPVVLALKKLGVVVYVVAIDKFDIHTASVLKRDATSVIELGNILEDDEILQNLLFK